MQRRFVGLHEASGGHTRYWLVFWSMLLLSFFKGILYIHKSQISGLVPSN
jgi:hypothetical protein